MISRLDHLFTVFLALFAKHATNNFPWCMHGQKHQARVNASEDVYVMVVMLTIGIVGPDGSR